MSKTIVLSIVSGALMAVFGFAAGMEYTTQKFERLQESVSTAEANLRTTLDGRNLAWMQRATDMQARAESCEKKFTVMTIMYAPKPAVSIPLLGGIAGLTLGDGSELVPVFVTPAQVTVNSPVPGARYRWQDIATGEIKGTFAALPPVAAQ